MADKLNTTYSTSRHTITPYTIKSPTLEFQNVEILSNEHVVSRPNNSDAGTKCVPHDYAKPNQIGQITHKNNIMHDIYIIQSNTNHQ